MSQAFHDIARFERFTDLKPCKYEFNVIQNWETDVLQILFDGAYFLLAVMVEGGEGIRLPALIDSPDFVSRLPELSIFLLLNSGAPNVNFWKISVRKTIWDLEFSEHLL